jgi:hypothetical protein
MLLTPVGKFDLGFKTTSTFFGQIRLRALLKGFEVAFQTNFYLILINVKVADGNCQNEKRTDILYHNRQNPS